MTGEFERCKRERFGGLPRGWWFWGSAPGGTRWIGAGVAVLKRPSNALTGEATGAPGAEADPAGLPLLIELERAVVTETAL